MSLENLSALFESFSKERYFEQHGRLKAFVDSVSTFSGKCFETSGLAEVLAGAVAVRAESAIRVAEHLQDLLNSFSSLEEKCREDNRQRSNDFNALSFFTINEPMHSFLLAQLLDPNGKHGQGIHFLERFLRLVGIEQPGLGNWVVTAEKGRIDILLKRSHPHSVVVIENKSNRAGDALNQLYRYWYQEIYRPQRHHTVDYAARHPERYQMLYLTPDDGKLPNSNTLERPPGWPETLPAAVPLPIKVIRYKDEVLRWLEESHEHLPTGNHRLRTYVEQYIELWK